MAGSVPRSELQEVMCHPFLQPFGLPGNPRCCARAAQIEAVPLEQSWTVLESWSLAQGAAGIPLPDHKCIPPFSGVGRDRGVG